MLGRGLISGLMLLLSGFTMYLNINLTDEHRQMIKEFMQETLETKKVLPQPKNITEVLLKEYKFNEDPLIKILNTTKFAHLKEVKICNLYEDQAKSDLHDVIEAIGKKSNLSQNEIQLMKLSLNGGRGVTASEVFIHGREGLYLLMKYTSARLASRNYDFMIANYGYSWTLDVLDLEEAQRTLQKLDNMNNVPLDMLPEEARTDVMDFLKVNSKTSITLEEKEEQTTYFRGLSNRSLHYRCPKLDK